MKIAGYEISLHNHGMFRLDGGAMFGAVPRNIWSRSISADQENCIQLATRCMLLKNDATCVLVDCGNGDKWSDKLRQIFAIENTPIESLGYRYENVTDLILTHLHFDHCGGISFYDSSGNLQARYPHARVIVQADNLENAKNPNLREKASYLVENYSLIDQLQKFLVRGSHEVLPGVFVHQVNGHTRGQQYIEVRDSVHTLLYPTDLIPTSHHLPLPYNMGYDICTETLLQEKQAFLEYALQRQAIVVFEHDPLVAAATIKIDGRGHYAVDQIVQLPEFGPVQAQA